jgi:predicted aspartyl protease
MGIRVHIRKRQSHIETVEHIAHRPLFLAFCVLLVFQAAFSQSSHTVRYPENIELEYDRRLSSIGFPNPLLKATVHGQTAWFIIDTGASVHTFASWLVSASGLRTFDTNSTVTGSTGVESRVTVIRDATLHLDRHNDEIPLREAIVADFPKIFAEQRIGGLISPQLLAPAGKAALLDLNMPRLTFGSPPVPSKGTRVCTNRDSQFTNRLYAAEVSVGDVKALVFVDTGATSTVVTASSPVAASLSDRTSGNRQVQGVGGEATTTLKTKPLQIHLAGTSRILALSFGGSPQSCGPDGVLAMDALRGCLLNLGESAFAWSCR